VKAAVIQTFRKDGSPLVTPVWFRERDRAYEVVIAEGDVKLAHLRRDRAASSSRSTRSRRSPDWRSREKPNSSNAT
jgi:hypothetical protein